MSDDRPDPPQNPCHFPSSPPACPPTRHAHWWHWDISPFLGLAWGLIIIGGHLWLRQLHAQLGIALQSPHIIQPLYWPVGIGIAICLISLLALLRTFRSRRFNDAGWLGDLAMYGGLGALFTVLWSGLRSLGLF